LAIYRSDFEHLQKLQIERFNLNFNSVFEKIQIDDFISPLILSVVFVLEQVYMGERSIVSYLLRQKNVDIDFQSEPLQYSALQVSTMTGNFEMLELLLGEGAEPNNPNRNCKTPLITCFIKELPQEYSFENQRVSYKMAQTLLDKGGNKP
jgi:hypothetical protein